MSTPTTSTGPTPPSGTSNPVPLRSWFKSIIDWIVGLSPAGATVYDTGWVTITPSAGMAGFIRARRIGLLVEIDVSLTGTFPVGVTTLAPAGAIPAGFGPTNQGNRRGMAALNGFPGMVYVAVGTGLLAVMNQTGASRTAVDGQVRYILG